MSDLNALSVLGLRVRYGLAEVLYGVDLESKEGQLTAVMGPNGAGKSTLLWSLMGLRTTTVDSVLLFGSDIRKLSPDARVARGLCLVPEGRRLFPAISVLDNLKSGAHLRRRDDMKASLDVVLELFPELKVLTHRQAGSLSGGEQQMVALGRAIMTAPKVLLLDEPSLGLGPLVVERIYEALLKLRQEGLTMVVVEQETDRILSIADYGYVLQSGEIAAQGSAQSLREDTSLAQAYFGSLDD